MSYGGRSHVRQSSVSSRWVKGLLAVGFAVLAVSVLRAHVAPARGYELSLYRATPVGFWVGIGISIVVSLFVSFSARASRYLRTSALALGGGSVLAIAALPVIRGYYFYGPDDSLDHLGWAKDIVAGTLDPSNLLYPGTHLIAIFLSDVAGVPLRLGIQYMTLVCFLAYLIFVPLCVRSIADHDWAVSLGLFSALLVLPINAVATHLYAHPSSQLILLLPLVFYLIIQYVVSPAESPDIQSGFVFGTRAEQSMFARLTDRFDDALEPTAIGILLALSSVAIVPIHPQETLNVLLVFAAIASVQFLCRRFQRGSRIARHQPMYAQTMILAAAFLFWTQNHPRIRETVAGVVESILSGATAASPEVATRSTSLTSVGGSISELFVKLFVPSLVFCTLAGGIAVVSLLDRTDTHRNAMTTYFSLATVPLVAVFAVFFTSDVGDHYFRTLGFAMVLATILGAVGLTRWCGVLSNRIPTATVKTMLVVFFVLMIPLSVVTIHNSPYIYQSSSQVTQMTMSGYETAFEHGAQGVEFVGIRGGPILFANAVYGTERAASLGYGETNDEVPERAFSENLTEYYERDHYLVVTETDFEREATLYGGFRYSRAEFDALDTLPGIHRVQSNGEFTLYLVSDTENGTESSPANQSPSATVTAPTDRRPSVGVAQPESERLGDTVSSAIGDAIRTRT